MARIKAKAPRTHYVCQACGYESPSFYGRCPDCGGWSTLVETLEVTPTVGQHRPVVGVTTPPMALSQVESAGVTRHPVAIDEFSRVLGGGVVPGSMVLIGGDPGVGKSTLLLQVAASLSQTSGTVLYVTGEESPQQVRLRADRLQTQVDRVQVLAATNMDEILAATAAVKPTTLVVDSIQTVYVPELTSAAGSVSQVRECTARLVQLAKGQGVTTFLVGHVTKEGSLAGPRVLEHMVDTVLYLEGERFQQYRILRAVKNRFGSTDEVGVFEMVEEGLREVRNPSAAFLQERARNAAGSAVTIAVEGTRPILVEAQALTTASAFGNARRTAAGFDTNRLHVLIAVLSKRAGMQLADQDVYVNIVGGLRLSEPAADLGIAIAVASSFRDTRVSPDLAVVGEIGLAGELRSVTQLERRLMEAAKLGFTRVLVPATVGRGTARPPQGLTIERASTLSDALDIALPR